MGESEVSGVLHTRRELRHRSSTYQAAGKEPRSNSVLRSPKWRVRGRTRSRPSGTPTGDRHSDRAGLGEDRRRAARRYPMHGFQQAPRAIGRTPGAENRLQIERRRPNRRLYANSETLFAITRRDDHIGALIWRPSYDSRCHTRIREN
jgi:hypothetical protein